jgi:hypothetical protein
MTEEKQPQDTEEGKIQEAARRARRRAYRLHRALNVPVAVMRDGKIVDKVPDEADIEAGRVMTSGNP